VRYARFCFANRESRVPEDDVPGDVAEGLGALDLNGDAGDVAAEKDDAPEP
jgi:hypothetical protein